MKSRLLGAVCVCIFTLCISLSANAALISRLSGQAVYDTDLDITWLADMNLAASNTFGVGGIGTGVQIGRMDWFTANTWIAAMNSSGGGSGYLGINDWRLPIADSCLGNNCTGGEMGHLFYLEFGATAGTSILATGNPTEVGKFMNVASLLNIGKWSGTEYAPFPSYVHYFNLTSGYAGATPKTIDLIAWAVRSGDVLGFLQSDPILPDTGPPPLGVDFEFIDVGSDQWFDPPLTDAYTYEMTGSSLFTDILDFPTGFNNSFNVSVGGTGLGIFGPGQSVDFVSLLGNGVSQFTLSGIDPLVDTEDPAAFPLKLSFDTATASFTMSSASAVPLPATLWLFTSGLIGLIGIAKKREAV